MVKNSRTSSYTFQYRFTFFGDKGVGKTSIIRRLLDDSFTPSYTETIEDHTTYVTEHNGEMCVCLLIDIGGGYDFPAMRKLHISKSNVFFVVYSMADKKTFATAKKIIGEITKLKVEPDELKIFLVASKSDMKSVKVGSSKEGEELCERLKEQNIQSQYVEVSAKDSDSVKNLFTLMLETFHPKPKNLIGSNSPNFRKFSIKNQIRKMSSSYKNKMLVVEDEENIKRSSSLGLLDKKPSSKSPSNHHKSLPIPSRNNNEAPLSRCSSLGNIVFGFKKSPRLSQKPLKTSFSSLDEDSDTTEQKLKRFSLTE